MRPRLEGHSREGISRAQNWSCSHNQDWNLGDSEGEGGEERAPVSLRSHALVSVWISHGLSQLEAVWQGIPEA